MNNSQAQPDFQEIWNLFRETDKRFKETDKILKEKSLETDKGR